MFTTFVLDRNEQEKIKHLLPADFVFKKENTITIVAMNNEEFVGIGLGEIHNEDEEFVIRDIVVSKEYLYLGIEECILDGLLWEMAKTADYPVSMNFIADEDHENLIELFEKRDDFEIIYGCNCYVLTKKEREDSEEYNEILNKDYEAALFFELPGRMQKEFIERLSEKEEIEYFARFEERMECMATDLCYAYIKDNRIVSAVFFERCGEKSMELSYAYSDSASPIPFFSSLCAAAKVFETKYEDYDVCIIAINEKSQGIVDKLFPSTFSFYPMVNVKESI